MLLMGLKIVIYNVPISVDTIRRRYPIKWTYQEGIEIAKKHARFRH